MSPPDAVLFDLDGTLIDRESLLGLAVRDVMAERGVALDEADAAAWVGRAWQDVYEAVGGHQATGWALGTWIDRVLARADELVVDGHRPEVLAGGAELIEELVTAGVAVAIVTGSSRRELDAAVEVLGIANLLRATVAAQDYDVGKPHPAPFLTGLERLGAQPDRSVAFEDSVAGVASARAAGLWVVATAATNPDAGHPAHQDLTDAHTMVGGLHEVTVEHLTILVRSAS